MINAGTKRAEYEALLHFYHRIATRLYQARYLLWALGVMGLAAFVYIVLSARTDLERYLLPLLLAFTWIVASIGVAYGFRDELPTAAAQASWWQRVKIALQRGYLWTMAALVSLVTVGIMALALRAITIAGGQ